MTDLKDKVDRTQEQSAHSTRWKNRKTKGTEEERMLCDKGLKTSST